MMVSPVFLLSRFFRIRTCPCSLTPGCFRQVAPATPISPMAHGTPDLCQVARHGLKMGDSPTKKNIGNMTISHQTFAGRLFSGRAVSHVLGICLGWSICVWTCLVIWNGSQYRIMVKIVVIKSVRGHHVQECFWCYFLTKKPALLSNPSMTSYSVGDAGACSVSILSILSHRNNVNVLSVLDQV